MSFAKNIGKNLSNKYGQKLPDSTKKSATDAIKTASKRAIQKPAGATGHLIDNKIVDKITSVSTKNDSTNGETEVIRYIYKKIYISRRKTANYWWIKVSIKRKIHISRRKAANY